MTRQVDAPHLSMRPERSSIGTVVTDWVPHHIDLFQRKQFEPAYLKLNPKAQVPFVARLDRLNLVEPWLADAPAARRWWQSAKVRPSYSQARVGPWADEIETMGTAGAKILADFEVKRANYLAAAG